MHCTQSEILPQKPPFHLLLIISSYLLQHLYHLINPKAKEKCTTNESAFNLVLRSKPTVDNENHEVLFHTCTPQKVARPLLLFKLPIDNF